MSYFAVAQLQIHESDWIPDYVEEVSPLVERYGGRYLARTPRVEWVEGEEQPGRLVVLIEWPSRDAAMEFYRSEAYRPHLEARRSGSSGDFLLVAGEDGARSS
ncbi:DUF1330 domain-containing protein [Nocardioides sp. SYSU DS0651]|uniref:DUF1330 domain-containing protein n=1 Tax=Nocardioides sp. SYSU DS0651 TaxID=3415955 RepID=UPI003F4BE70E